MTDNITLPRAVVEQVREALLSFDNWWDDEADTALAALDAALAEPDAKPEPATGEQVNEDFIERVWEEAKLLFLEGGEELIPTLIALAYSYGMDDEREACIGDILAAYNPLIHGTWVEGASPIENSIKAIRARGSK
jgi:hypothetical protein